MLPPGPAYLSPLPGMEGVEEKEKAHFIKTMQHKTWTHVLIWKANVTALSQPAGTQGEAIKDSCNDQILQP